MRIVNPATDELLAEVAEDSEQSIADKLARARRAQRVFARQPYVMRSAILERFRALVVAEQDKLAATLSAEVGKPITQSNNELRGMLGRIDFFLARAAAELEPESVLSNDGLEERINHEPLGVVGNVSAWNYPYFVGCNVFLPALLTGNAVLYKPSEYATLTGLEIARLLREAGLPNDLFSPVLGGGRAGASLVDASIDALFFTGSYATGRAIATALGPRMLKLQLELGGKDPVYVADDVDVESVAPAVADGAFYNCGQSCCAVERVYVHERVWEPFRARFLQEVRGFVLGDPTDSKTYIGPLARRGAALELLSAQCDDALAQGATLELGGVRAARPGWYFEPTVFTGVDHRMRLMREETFGPLIGLMKVASDEQAAELMADTEYGLTAGVYTRDQARAETLLSQLDVGSAYWNCCDRVSPRLPWSGRQHSGIGVTLSTYGIEAFLRPKAWHLKRPG